MLTIHPIQTKEEQEKLCNLCDITFRPDNFAYAAYVSGKFVGMSQFSVCDEYGTLNDLVPAPDANDIEALFIMGRQTMNWIDLIDIHTCHCREGATSDRLISTLGFKKDIRGILTADMTHMFDGHCTGHCNIAEELKSND